MRVTSNTYSSALVSQLNSLGSRQTQLQNQAATGQRVQTVSDDPIAARRVLELQAEARSVDQYQTNVATEQDLSKSTYQAIKSLKTISDRIGEIVTSADGTKTKEELTDYANEVTSLIQQAVQIANTQYDGSYLFGGTLTDQTPFTTTADATGQISSVTYHGNQSTRTIEISEGISFSSQVVGANSSGSGPRGLITDTASGADFFNHMISLQNNLVAGNTKAINAVDRVQVNADADNFLVHMSENGVQQARLEATATVLTNRGTSIDSQVSKEANADLAQTLVQFNATQNAYKAALQSGAQILNLSLLDYLR